MLRRKKWIPIAIVFLLLVIASGAWLAWNVYSLGVVPLNYLLIGCGAAAGGSVGQQRLPLRHTAAPPAFHRGAQNST